MIRSRKKVKVYKDSSGWVVSLFINGVGYKHTVRTWDAAIDAVRDYFIAIGDYV